MYSTPQTGSTPTWQKVLNSGVQIYSDYNSGASRRGGSDPCCPPGYNPPEPWPTNANQAGAPPDYRTKGSPFEDPSPSGTGRKKDDFCDCIPFEFNGKYYMVGVLTADGGVTTGLPTDSSTWPNAVYVQVDPQTRAPIAVPGIGAVKGTTPGGGSGSGVIPTAAAASLGPLALLVGAGIVATKLVRR